MFQHLRKLDVAADATSWLDLPELGRGNRLLLAPATQANTPFFNAMLKKGSKRAKQLARLDQLTKADIDAMRADDRELYAVHIVRGWEGDAFHDMEGKPVEFSREAARDLCQQLPDWLFDKVRDHASVTEKFVQADPEALSGN